MPKTKFDILNEEDTKEVIDEAALEETKAPVKKPAAKFVKFEAKIPSQLNEIIMDEDFDESRVAFVLRAVKKLAKEEGLIK